MAENMILNVAEGYDLAALADRIASTYQQKGFSANVTGAPNGIMVRLEKNLGGLNTLLGLGKGITVYLSLNGNTLQVSYSQEEWNGKIIAIAIGWIVCFIPLITGILGAVEQSNLSKEINNDIRMLL